MHPSIKSMQSGKHVKRNHRNRDRKTTGIPGKLRKHRCGKASSIGSDEFKNVAKMKDVRRRKSLDMFAMNKEIRNSAEMSMMGAFDSIVFEGTPLERLQTVMTKAKESGLSADKIFSFFKGQNDTNENTRISKKEFLCGLERVGDSIFVLADEELDELVQNFDVDNDGMISLDEFRTFCYFKIPSLAWKAERQRLEQSGEMDVLKKRLSSRLSNQSDNQVSCGFEFCNTSKLFWRINANVQIHMYYCKEMDVITIQSCKETSNNEMAPIFVRKKDCMIDKKELDETILYALQTSGVRTEEEKIELRKKVELDYYAKFLLERMQLKDTKIVPPTKGTPLGGSSHEGHNTCVAYLSKLSSDECHTVMIQKPDKLLNPPPLKKSTVQEFKQVAASFDKAARSARTSRQSAQDMSNMVESALSEVSSELSLDTLELKDV